MENASISIPEVLNPQAALDIHVKKHNVQVPYKPSNRICDDMVSNINCLYHFKTPLNNRITEGEIGSREKKPSEEEEGGLPHQKIVSML